MSKKALGKGIGALFKDIDETVNSQAVAQIPVDALKPNPYQPRRYFEDEALRELSNSIAEKGILQPILAEEDKSSGDYIIISGERRVRAARLAGLATVPAILGSFSVMEKLENALIENIQRENLSALEEAEGYKRLLETFNLNQEDIAKKVGKNRSTITNSLRLLKLPGRMRNSIEEGIISAGHARAILSLVNPGDQELLFKTIVDKGLSVREAERLASEYNRGNKGDAKRQKVKRERKRNPELGRMEDNLLEVLGTRVEIKGSPEKGRIEITYLSMEDLERIMDIISR